MRMPKTVKFNVEIDGADMCRQIQDVLIDIGNEFYEAGRRMDTLAEKYADKCLIKRAPSILGWI